RVEIVPVPAHVRSLALDLGVDGIAQPIGPGAPQGPHVGMRHHLDRPQVLPREILAQILGHDHFASPPADIVAPGARIPLRPADDRHGPMIERRLGRDLVRRPPLSSLENRRHTSPLAISNIVLPARWYFRARAVPLAPPRALTCRHENPGLAAR